MVATYTFPSATRAELGRHVHVSVRPLPHFPDAHVQLSEQRLPAFGLRRLTERDTLKRLPVQSADEKAPLPPWEPVAGVEGKAGRADRWHPEHPRVLHAGPVPRLVGDERARVVPSHGDQRPAVVATGQQDVHLVATHRPDFSLPQLPRLGMEREPISVAMPVGEDLRLRSRPADERIIGRHGPVVAKPQRLAGMVSEILRLHPKAVVVGAVAADAIAIADGDVEHAVGSELDAPREIAAGLPGVGDEDLLDAGQRRAVQTSTRDGERAPPLPLLRVRHIHQSVLRELRVHGHEVKAVAASLSPLAASPALTTLSALTTLTALAAVSALAALSPIGPLPSLAGRGLRRSGQGWKLSRRGRNGSGPDGLGIEHAVPDDSKPARLLGHQHRAAVGKERQAPRMDEAGGERHDAYLTALHVEHLRGGSWRRLLRAPRESLNEGKDRNTQEHGIRAAQRHGRPRSEERLGANRIMCGANRRRWRIPVLAGEVRKRMDLEKARKTAEKYLAMLEMSSGIEVQLLDEHTTEGDFGWVFFYESKKYMASGSIGDRLAGNAPIIVDRSDGSLHETGTAYPIEHYIDAFLRSRRISGHSQ